jgi:hypothetical protein
MLRGVFVFPKGMNKEGVPNERFHFKLPHYSYFSTYKMASLIESIIWSIADI